MKTFIDNLCNIVVERFSNDLKNIAVVFPSRRACLFFKTKLAEKFKEPVWSPTVFSIQDFVIHLSGYSLCDALKLNYTLYSVYNKIQPGEKFEEFYPWGEILMRDFDMIDKNLVNTKFLFRNVKELNEIEDTFPTELKDSFLRFWRSIYETTLTEEKKNFIRIWEVIDKIYNDFREELSRNNFAYEGMMYKEVYENIVKDKINILWSKIIFAGFNALTQTESGIIEHLNNSSKAEIYFDADTYYLDNKNNEAGYFIRKAQRDLKLKSINWKADNLLNDEKYINVVGTPLKTGMVKAVASELFKFLKTNPEPENTAVILPDENLLIPLLDSLPDNIGNFNVTMGFPFIRTAFYNLIRALKNFHTNKTETKDGVKFYFRDFLHVVNQPYLKPLLTDIIGKQTYDTEDTYKIYLDVINNKNSEYVNHKIKFLFQNLSSSQEIINYLREVVNLISSGKKSSADFNESIKKESVYNFQLQLNNLEDLFSGTQYFPEAQIFWKILFNLIESVRIPFSGEPIRGIQIMGVLESRSLDFENVFILSLNEGIFPGKNIYGSFIPYTFRKVFSLPTTEDEDRIYAYYFYRIIQRSKNIFLFYNTETDSLYGEKSRFILQMEKEIYSDIKQKKLPEKTLTPEVIILPNKPIGISKTKTIIKQLMGHISYSPTSLSSFINCGLQFYLQEIVKLEEEPEIEEAVTGRDFGSIFHKLIQIIYKPYIGLDITELIIDDIYKNTENNFEKLFLTALESIPDISNYDFELYGRNYLIKNIIKTLITRLLSKDKENVPYKIIALEQKVSHTISLDSLGEVKLKGFIDRIDEKDEVIRIIDYKTGGLKKNGYSHGDLFEYYLKMIEEPSYRELFQTTFYAYLYSREFNKKNIKAGIYHLKKLSDGISWTKNDCFTENDYILFETNLKNLIYSIYDSKTPFFQTPDKERCQYCSYRELCGREPYIPKTH